MAFLGHSLHQGTACVFLSILLATAASLVVLPGIAWSDVPVVYHSPNDDGVPLTAPLDVLPGSSNILYLYIDGGNNGSPEIRCATGTGDETCFWNVVLRGAASVTIADFTPNAGIVHYLDPSGVTIGINGGDPWRGDLGPRRIGELVIDGGAYGGALELVSGESVNSGLGVDALVPVNIVPEPATGLSLSFGGLLLGAMVRRRAALRPCDRRRGERPMGPALSLRLNSSAFVLAIALSLLAATPVNAQVSTDCGDVVADGTIDAADLVALRRFLAGDPTAPDLQGDPVGLARCDVTGDGICGVSDYVRIRRYMIDLTGGLNETCPLAGTIYPPAVLAPPAVDQPSTSSTDRASVRLSGTAEPGTVIRVEGAPSNPTAIAVSDGRWSVEVPLVLDNLNSLQVRSDFGAGFLSPSVSVSVAQTSESGLGVLEGTVVDASSDEPIEGATVSVHGSSTTADSFGRFRFTGLPEGRAILRAESVSYVPAAMFAEADAVDLAGSGEVVTPGALLRLVPTAASQMIGAAGGTVTSASGLELIVPSGALSADTEIALTELVGMGASTIGGVPMVDIGPGAITFDPPAVLRLPFAGFAPGSAADVVQVDQAAGAVTPLVSTTNASGVVEVEVHSTAGDGFNTDPFADPAEAEFRIGDNLLTKTRNVTVENCDLRESLGWSTRGGWRAVSFEGDPDGGASFWLRGRYETDPSVFFGAKGLWDYDGLKRRFDVSEYAEVNPRIPPGKIQLARATVRRIPVEQPVYVFRVPDGGGSWSKNRVGSLSYEVDFLVDLELVALVDCPEAQAGAYGDPHLIRFDHVGQALPLSSGNGRFDFQGAGEFILFESTEDAMVVQARMVPANGSTTVMSALAMDIDGDRVSIYSAPVLDVRIEGVSTPLSVGVPVALPSGGELERGTTLAGKDLMIVRWSDGTEMKVSEWSTSLSYLNVFPRLSAPRFAKVQGILGNANGVIGDDLNLRDGTPSTPAELYTTFADSWRISQAESLFDYEPGEDTSTYNGTPVDPDYTVADLAPVAVAAAEADCVAAGVTADPGLSECIIDVVVFSDSSAVGPASDAQAELPDTGVTVIVPATSNIFGAGLSAVPDFGAGGTGNGTLPPGISLPAGTGRTIRLLDAAGAVRFFPTENPTCPPDGKLLAMQAIWGTWGGLTGPNSDRRCELAMVFLTDDERPPVAPAAYESGNLTDEYVTPTVGQIFSIGDGLTPEGDVQVIFVPDDATRLFLGLLARFNFDNPEPGWYGDNSGRHEVILEIAQ
jgi:Carboxypeptidase regulatory-like domain/Dockerin type I domain